MPSVQPRDRLVGKFSGGAIEVVRHLGAGVQGDVWEVVFDGRAHALKWYTDEYLPRDPAIRERLDRMIHSGRPSDSFIWPIEAAHRAGVSGTAGGVGYVMPLLEPRFASMRELLTRRIEPDFHALCTAGMHLAHGFLKLHTRGLSYCDISFNNVAIDGRTGDIRITDNDNVDVDRTEGPIKGTPLFMAPEILVDAARPWSGPDLHALAVLLFYMFLLHHPFEGSRELTPEFSGGGQRRLYEDPLFIFDAADHSNAPDPSAHPTPLAFWEIYPHRLKEAFRRAFGAGLRDPRRRVQEGEWRSTMLRLRDALFVCGGCGVENFYDSTHVGGVGHGGRCWACQAVLWLPPRLRVLGEIVVLSPGRRLFPHHLVPGREFDLSHPLAEVGDDGRIRNLSASAWTCSVAGRGVTVEPGDTLPAATPGPLTLGGVPGEIRV
jgi:eukaryotic-like serine/threonine-protein kinase